MVLRQGDTVFANLERFASEVKLPFANFSAFGFLNVTFGFFDAKTKNYDSTYFENLEMGAVNGSIAWQNGKPSLHIHGTGSDKTFKAFGGHMLSAVVSTGSLEVFITVSDKKLERLKDEALGANVLEVK
jgi:predicted DNA-binding protein with PD1-like motif